MKLPPRKPLTKFTVRDSILSHIGFQDPCPVMVEITEDSVILRIGPREISWDRYTGRTDNTGTLLMSSREDDE